MTLLSLVRQAREMWQVPKDLALRRYPDFVRGGPLPRGHVPVFVFHSLEHEPFSRQLEYLAGNGYVTLGATEYFQHLVGTRPAPERAVVLTFDDGRGSLWSIGLPLMRRYGMRGIALSTKYVVDLERNAVAEITISGTADDDGLARRIIESLKTTTARSCFWPDLERLLKGST